MNKNTHRIPVARTFLGSSVGAPIRARVRRWGATGAIRACLAVVTVMATAWLFTGTVFAAIQGYTSADGQPIPKGMAVAVDTQGSVTTANNAAPGVVEKSSLAQADKTVGVVVEMQGSTVSVSDPGSQVYVANSGVALVFTTDINGTVHKGDLLAPSPIRGVLMRATEGTKGVLGVALEDFPTEGTETVKLNTENGQKDAQVAPVTINMDVKFVTNTSGNGKTLLQRLGEAIVGREVSVIQVTIAMTIVVLVVLVEGGIIYATVSSTIISLGRNPYARKTILRALFQIIILVAVVLVLGMAAVYLVLWL